MPGPELKEINAKTPNQSLIDYVTELLEWAKSGDLRSITGVNVWHSYSMSNLDCGRDGSYTRTIIGQLEIVKSHIVDEIKAEEIEGHESGI